MQEIETRIIKIDVNKIKEKLINLGCKKVKDENQINNLYDFPDRRMLNKKGYARIRIVEDNLNNVVVNYMTTKKLLSQEKYKIMEENEVIIDNSTIGAQIFTSLGLELVESIKKHRESYQFKTSLIEIDINDPSFCPFPYLEIEGTNEDEIKEIVALLGYTMEDTTSKTIYELLQSEGIVKGV
ncbi:class IV adenylate cyclase [Clostridium culturomicium]|uniref:class IV adenylate cyclase n=1 Tax=Clostridium culturomicium TaxID=1499683 RepID=UPI00058CAA52|nr:CYTH domain-containing protein [Clostridium culturomicium]